MAPGGDYDLLRYYTTTTTSAYPDSRRQMEAQRRYMEQMRAPSPCLSCGETHGVSDFNELGECELTQVKKLEEAERIEKKHNDNIRKLYWERYSRANYA